MFCTLVQCGIPKYPKKKLRPLSVCNQYCFSFCLSHSPTKHDIFGQFSCKPSFFACNNQIDWFMVLFFNFPAPSQLLSNNFLFEGTLSGLMDSQKHKQLVWVASFRNACCKRTQRKPPILDLGSPFWNHSPHPPPTTRFGGFPCPPPYPPPIPPPPTPSPPRAFSKAAPPTTQLHPSQKHQTCWV